jgi:hypothetical protein
MRKHGGWCVELVHPLKHQGADIAAIEIRRPNADQVIRWRQGHYASILAFVSQLCGVSERLLRQLDSDDFDRIIFAFMNCMPPAIKDDLESSGKPLATPDEELSRIEPAPVPDQRDPRFPAVDGPVVRLAEKKPPPEEPPAMDFSPPPVSEAVR